MTRVTQAHIDARTQDILGAAKRLFARKGVDGTTMQEIAADAGLSAGAVYRYYESKDDLLRAVFEDCSEQHRALFEEKAAVSPSPMEALTDIGRSAWSQLKGDGFRDEVILELETALAAARHPDELGPAHRETLDHVVEMLGRLIRDAQAAGQIEAGVDGQALALTLLACYLGSGILALDGQDTDVLVESLLHMVNKLAPVAGRNGGR